MSCCIFLEQYGMPPLQDSRTKDQMADLILAHELAHDTTPVEMDFQKFFLQNNFMAPIRKEHLTLGLNNEPCVIQILPHFIKKHARNKGDFIIAPPGLYLSMSDNAFLGCTNICKETYTFRYC